MCWCTVSGQHLCLVSFAVFTLFIHAFTLMLMLLGDMHNISCARISSAKDISLIVRTSKNEGFSSADKM